MAEEHKTTIRIDGNEKGAIAALRRVASSVLSLSDKLRDVRQLASRLMASFGTFGFAVHGVQMLVTGWNYLKDKLEETRNRIQQVRIEQAKTSYAKIADDLKNASEKYDDYNKKIERSIRLEKLKNEILTGRKTQERDVDDADLERRKQLEIARLDPNAKDYAMRKSAIERRYEQKVADVRYERSREDANVESGRLRKEADAVDKKAAVAQGKAETQWERYYASSALETRIKRSGLFKSGDADTVESYRKAREETERQYQEWKKLDEEAKRIKDEAESLRVKAAETTGRAMKDKLRAEATSLKLANDKREEDARAKAEEDKKREADSKKKAEEDKRKAEDKKKRDQNLEDAQLARMKQEDLAALDPNDPNYARRKNEIEETYEIKAAELKRDRATTPEDRQAADAEREAIGMRQERERREEEAERAAAYSGKLADLSDSSRPKDRLTAMGLGSGGTVDRTAQEQAQNVKTLVQLVKEEIAAIRANNNGNVAVYAP